MSNPRTMPGSILETIRSRETTPLIMGILNVTPDSFYDGGEHNQLDAAVARARDMIESGADLLDVGGESTRPGAEPVPESEEIDRVVPVINRLRDNGVDVPISVDTRTAVVAERALDAGADWINDVTGLREDPAMVELVADRDVPVVLMHMQGTPKTMQNDPQYDDVVEEVTQFFRDRLKWATQRGVDANRVILDPGIGFGKTLEHNRGLLNAVERFGELAGAVLVGHSRKSFLDGVIGVPPEERLVGTLAVSSRLMTAGVDILRVHDVREHQQLRETITWLDEDGSDAD